jgi:hypothetical protein
MIICSDLWFTDPSACSRIQIPSSYGKAWFPGGIHFCHFGSDGIGGGGHSERSECGKFYEPPGRDSQDMGTVAMKPTESIRLTVPMNFHGTYICEFSATGKRNTSFDVVSPKCKCDGYWGCQWVVRSDGFYCNYALLYVWAQ